MTLEQRLEELEKKIAAIEDKILRPVDPEKIFLIASQAIRDEFLVSSVQSAK